MEYLTPTDHIVVLSSDTQIGLKKLSRRHTGSKTGAGLRPRVCSTLEVRAWPFCRLCSINQSISDSLEWPKYKKPLQGSLKCYRQKDCFQVTPEGLQRGS